MKIRVNASLEHEINFLQIFENLDVLCPFLPHRRRRTVDYPYGSFFKKSESSKNFLTFHKKLRRFTSQSYSNIILKWAKDESGEGGGGSGLLQAALATTSGVMGSM
jgi:hypothetical protein